MLKYLIIATALLPPSRNRSSFHNRASRASAGQWCCG
jgi:hypothetical protein